MSSVARELSGLITGCLAIVVIMVVEHKFVATRQRRDRHLHGPTDEQPSRLTETTISSHSTVRYPLGLGKICFQNCGHRKRRIFKGSRQRVTESCVGVFIDYL